MNASPGMTASQRTTPDQTQEADDALVTLARHGKPPLRVRPRSGRRLESLSPDNVLLYAEILFRQRGGVALAFSRPAGGAVFDDAVSAPDIASACGQARIVLTEGDGGRRRRRKRSRFTATEAARRLASRGEAALRARDLLAMLSDLEAQSAAGEPDPLTHAPRREAD